VGLVVLVINLLSGRRSSVWRQELRAPASKVVRAFSRCFTPRPGLE